MKTPKTPSFHLWGIALLAMCGAALAQTSTPPATPPTTPPAAIPATPPPASAQAARHTIPGVIVATDYRDLQAAVDAVPAPGGVIYLPPGTYKLSRPLDMTNKYNNGEKTRWIVFQGAGQMNSIITGDFPDAPVIDMTGSGRVTMSDLAVSGKSKSLLLSARRSGAGGGGNVFTNCMFRGDHVEVAIWLVGSECNRFYNTTVYVNQPNSVAVAFTPVPKFEARGISYEIASPYEKNMTGSSTTELRFYGSFIQSFGFNSIGLYCQGSTADISMDGCYNANSGFASIFLDGRNANVGDSSFRSVRIEGETGLYCLYAVGAVRNVTIDSGNWGSAGEVIRYEAAKDGHAANSGAEGWSIRNSSLTIQDQSARKPESSTGALCKIPREERAILRFDRMDNFRIENIWVRAYQIVLLDKPDEKSSLKGNKDHATVIQNAEFKAEEKLEYYNPKLVVCSDWARGNTISTAKRDQIVFPADAQGNQVVALDDNGVRRTYLSGGTRPEVLNFDPVDVRGIKNPRAGDVSMDNGSLRGDGSPCLVFFDGRQWVPAAGKGN